MKVYGYLRVSGKGQVDGHGFDRQRETIEAWAAKADSGVVRWFSEAHTGTEADRPAFMDMLAATNGVRTLVVESLDRFARDSMIQSALLTKLIENGLTLISASTGDDVTASFQADPMRRAMIQMQGVFSELDKALIVRKLRKAREAKRKRSGRCEGRKPFGEREGESEIIARIIATRDPKQTGRVRPHSFKAIADMLNSDDVPTRTGAPWAPETVRGIVKRTRPDLISKPRKAQRKGASHDS